jgi:hypothetical protein
MTKTMLEFYPDPVTGDILTREVSADDAKARGLVTIVDVTRDDAGEPHATFNLNAIRNLKEGTKP